MRCQCKMHFTSDTLALVVFWNNGFPYACSGTRSFAWSSSFSIASPILVLASGLLWSGCDVVWILVSLTPDCLHPFWGASFNNVNLVKSSPWLWHISVVVNIPVSIQSFFLCNLQICISWPVDINIIRWNKIWFFCRHVQLNPRFNMMTINEISLNRPEVFSSFRVIFCFLRLNLFPFAMRFSAELLSPCGGFPSQSGFLEFVASPWQCCWNICRRNYKFFISGYQDFFCIKSSGINFWCIQLYQFFNISNQNVSLPNCPRDLGITNNNSS